LLRSTPFPYTTLFRSNSYVALDGADFNDPLQGNQRGGNDPVFFFPLAAVREFQVVRSGLDAEVGRTNAGFVNAVTKSGTNDWHRSEERRVGKECRSR